MKKATEKCKRTRCYLMEKRTFKGVEQPLLKCKRCRKPIEVGTPVHSFMDLMSCTLANYHCGCASR